MYHRPTLLAISVALLACTGSARDDTDAYDGSARTGADSIGGRVGGDAESDTNAPSMDMQRVLDALAALGPTPIHTLSPAEARRQPTPADAVQRVLLELGNDTTVTVLVPGIVSRDGTLPGPAGPLPIRVYTPDGDGPFPVIVYYHGGGWVIGSKEVYDGGARGLAKGVNAVVVSVDYRLAPEHKFPAQHDDALAAYRWVTLNMKQLNGRAGQIALAGESAGGNLALATAVAAIAAGLPKPVHVLSVYPIAQADTMTPSYIRYANAKPLSRSMMSWFAGHTTRTPADLMDPRISLVKASFAGVPPVTIVNAGIDPLLDDGAMVAEALRAAGVSVDRRVWENATHEFFGMASAVGAAREAQAYAAGNLREAFGALP